MNRWFSHNRVKINILTEYLSKQVQIVIIWLYFRFYANPVIRRLLKLISLFYNFHLFFNKSNVCGTLPKVGWLPYVAIYNFQYLCIFLYGYFHYYFLEIFIFSYLFSYLSLRYTYENIFSSTNGLYTSLLSDSFFINFLLFFAHFLAIGLELDIWHSITD